MRLFYHFLLVHQTRNWSGIW